MDPAPMVEAAKIAYEKGLAMLNDMSGWKKLNDVDGVTGYEKPSDGIEFRTYKADFYINRAPKASSRFVFDNYADLNVELNPEDMEFFREKA